MVDDAATKTVVTIGYVLGRYGGEWQIEANDFCLIAVRRPTPTAQEIVTGRDAEMEDIDLTASLAEGWVIVAMVVAATDAVDAIWKTVATVRAAVQKIGHSLPAWERITALASLSVPQLPSGKPPRCETIG